MLIFFSNLTLRKTNHTISQSLEIWLLNIVKYQVKITVEVLLNALGLRKKIRLQRSRENSGRVVAYK